MAPNGPPSRSATAGWVRTAAAMASASWPESRCWAWCPGGGVGEVELMVTNSSNYRCECSLHAGRLRGCLTAVVAWDVDVVDRDIDLDDLQPDHLLDGANDVAARRLGKLHDGRAVLDDEVEVDRGLLLADLDRHPGGVRGAGAARDALADPTERPGQPAAQRVHSGDLTSGHPGDLLHHRGRDGGLALRGVLGQPRWGRAAGTDRRGRGARRLAGGAGGVCHDQSSPWLVW